MEADDLLADKMHIGRPEVLVIVILIVHEAQGSGIVKQRIHPDIDHMTRIKIHGNAPGKAGTRYTQVLQTGIDKVIDHLIDAAARL